MESYRKYLEEQDDKELTLVEKAVVYPLGVVLVSLPLALMLINLPA